jgi:hypothetical protein
LSAVISRLHSTRPRATLSSPMEIPCRPCERCCRDEPR